MINPAQAIATTIVLFAGGVALSQADPGAAWELNMLGVNDPARLEEMASFAKQRTVKLAIVGQGGVSEKQLASMLIDGNKVVYHDCTDPDRGTHDTSEANVILAITNALGVTVELHVWQPGEAFADVADKFRQAGEVADIVCMYQSFWGPTTPAIHEAIRQSNKAMFVSPYVEVAAKPTNNTPQGSACKPWTQGSILHFVTAVPLSRRGGNGSILTPKDRGEQDSEAINFIAPSYYASGAGGTCPSGAVTAACAVYLYAVMESDPTPKKVIDLLRDTVTVDRALLTSAEEFDDAAIDLLEKQIDALRNPGEGKQRKLDAPGVLNLYKAFRHIAGNAAKVRQAQESEQ